MIKPIEAFRRSCPRILRHAVHAVFVALLAACATPYRPPVIVSRSIDFPGLGHLVKAAQPLHVLLVHGMCTHDDDDADRSIDALHQAIERNIRTEPLLRSAAIEPTPRVRVYPRNDTFAFGDVRFHALMWSDMTTPLKRQLEYDKTGVPSDCGTVEDPALCKPKRARYNGRFKDTLLDDCLADALIYQGDSRAAIRSSMIAALTEVMQEIARDEGSVAIVTESLGSKIAFDALVSMLDKPANPPEAAAAELLAVRLGAVYMEANQLPILGLADQDIGAMYAPPGAARPGPGKQLRAGDPLQRFLEKRQGLARTPLKVVAFTDPNDLLSYRLLSSRYASFPNVELADVLVSNDNTYFGLLENPDAAHRRYGQNPDVAVLIACGRPKSDRCR